MAMEEAQLGRKKGMTQVFGDDGSMIPVTVVEAGPCTVVGVRTKASHGYDALQIGFETAPCEVMRWIEASDKAKLTRFIEANRSSVAVDSDRDHVDMAPSVFSVNWVAERNPDIRFIDVKAVTQG